MTKTSDKVLIAALLVANPFVLLGIGIFVLLMILFFGFFIRFAIGTALTVVGLMLFLNSTVRTKHVWIPIFLTLIGVLLIWNPGEFFSVLNFAPGV